MTAKDVKEITFMPLVTFFSVLERPGKTVRGVATTPPWLDEGYTAKTPVLNSTPPVLWEVHTKLVLILTPVGVSLIPLGVKFNTGGCYSNTYQC